MVLHNQQNIRPELDYPEKNWIYHQKHQQWIFIF